MKNRIEYVYSCTNAMFNYLKDNNTSKMLVELNKVRNHLISEDGYDIKKELKFQFGSDKALVSFHNIIEATVDKDKHEVLLELFDRVTKDINPDNELKVFYC